MLFGELKYNGSNCRFQLNEFELSIHSMDVPVGAMPLELITTELPPVNEVLLGTCYPDGKAIAIYVNGYWNSSNNVLFQKVRWYIKFSRRQSKLSALKISADELNEIFPVSRAIHGWSTEESTAEYSLKIKPFNSEAYEFQHEGRQVTCQYVMHWGISQRNTSAPVHIGTQFVMRFEATDDYLFCSSLIGIGKHYFEYLCYRQNISINSIVALTQSESGRYIECGEFSAPWILTAEKEDEKVIRKKCIPEYLIEQGNTLLLQSISDGIIYLRHIPKSTADNRVLTPARFVMVTAAFEWEYRKLFPQGVPHTTNTIEARKLAKKKIDDLIESTKESKVKRILKQARGSVFFDSLESKIVHACKEFDDCVRPFGEYMFKLNNQEYKPEIIGRELSIQRNNFAHGNLDKEFSLIAALGVNTLQDLVYAMQLTEVGVSKANIRKAINMVMGYQLGIE